MENTDVKNGANIPTDHTGTDGAQDVKTFTQEEVNKIVQERLARVKAVNVPDQREMDLQRRETDVYIREQVIKNELPAELTESLKGLDKDVADKCINIIAPYARKAKEPFLNAVAPTGGGGMQGDAIRRAMGLKG